MIVRSAKYNVPSTMCKVPSTMYQVQSTKYFQNQDCSRQVRSERQETRSKREYQVVSSKQQEVVRSTKYQVPSTFKIRIAVDRPTYSRSQFSPLLHSSVGVGHSTLRKYLEGVPSTKYNVPSTKYIVPSTKYFQNQDCCRMSIAGIAFLCGLASLREKKKRIAPRNAAGRATKLLSNLITLNSIFSFVNYFFVQQN